MILHNDKDEFVRAVKFTAETMGTKPIYIEKDYW